MWTEEVCWDSCPPHMAKVKKGVAKRKARRKAAKRAANADPDAAQSAAAAAVEYLQQWAAREEQPWKFVKSRQTFLLQKWPDREKVTAETFRDLLLPYFQTLTAGCAQRTIEQAASPPSSCSLVLALCPSLAVRFLKKTRGRLLDRRERSSRRQRMKQLPRLQPLQSGLPLTRSRRTRASWTVRRSSDGQRFGRSGNHGL